MRSLLDVNVLVALLDRAHTGHLAAHEWLAAHRTDGWASCPLTENGTLRILTNPRYPAPVTPAEVLTCLAATRAGGNHEFWPADISVTDERHFDRSRMRGHQQVTDLYLLALAIAHGGRLVTFDQGISIAAIPGATEANLVIITAVQP